ncbi:MAG: hypothetical protein HDQ88_09835 [Clostridia bacterium]|nr:hypothetical protein [Clostridia bacterium]
MNLKLKYLYTLVAIIAVVIFCGCEQRQNYVDNAETIWLDTITIHDNRHEILLRSTNPASNTNAGGMMHSPECWCKKGVEI